MRVCLLADPHADVTAETGSFAVLAEAITRAWHLVSPHTAVDVFAVGDGGPGAASSMTGTRREGDVTVTEVGEHLVLAPRGGATRWDPAALARGLLDAATAMHDTPRRPTLVIPLGDVAPAGDATALWAEGVEAMREQLAAVPMVALVSSLRPLLGFQGMSSALRDGREHDAAIAVAAQRQEERWTAIARDVDPVTRRTTLMGSGRLSDAPGTGAAGGLAYCLASVGARLTPGAPYIARLVGAEESARGADVVVSVVGELTPRTIDNGPVVAAASLAAQAGVPCVVITSRIAVGRRDLMAATIASAHPAEPGLEGLGDAIRRVAQTWTR